MIKICPSVLACDFSRFGEEVVAMEKAGADMIHLDVMDGHFVPNISFGAPVIKSIKGKTILPFDVHLMISNPLKYHMDFINAGAHRITFHVEADDDIDETIKAIKSNNVEVGLTLKPGTSIDTIIPYLDEIDQVLVMTVEPGFGGQSFMKDQCEKVLTLAKLKKEKGLSFDIQVDGGIDNTTAPIVASYGANSLVAGSALYKLDDYDKGVADLRAAAEKGLESPLF